jgi:hypothetical protein
MRLLELAAIGMAAALCSSAVALADAASYPDWSGQWIRVESGQPRYDHSKPPGLGQEAPLTVEYRALYEASLADQKVGGQGLDPGQKCIPMGMPRQMSGFFPFEFVTTPGATYLLFEYSTYTTRRVFTDGRAWPGEIEPTFSGYSIGKWIDTRHDGRFDTLEVETRGFMGPRVFDGSGTPMHEDNATVITERIYLDKADPNLLHDEITTNDHALTHPWTALKNFRRMPKVLWTENTCTLGANHVYVGNEDYLLSGDGYLMPVRKNQPPPDLRYFKQATQR